MILSIQFKQLFIDLNRFGAPKPAAQFSQGPEAPLEPHVGPTWSQLGFNLAQFASHVGPTWPQLASHCGTTLAPTCLAILDQLGSNLASGPKMQME